MSLKDFQMITKLGQGAYSTVYKVKRLIDNQQYALKKVKMNNLSEKQKQNALNEVRILASIEHPNIIAYKQAFIEKGTNYLCIIMEFADKGDLLQQIKDHQRNNTSFPEEEVWSVFIQITQGLKVLHDMKILHRDIKSANIFLTKNGQAKLGDLNVSKMVKSMCQTQTGTPYYASPQIWKDQPYDKKSDIWSLGCVLYEMISLKPPFRANDMQGLYKKISRGFYTRLPPEYSNQLTIVLKLMLQVAPHLRSSCDKILQFPIVMKNMIFLPQAYQKKGKAHDLMRTIKIDERNGIDQLKNRVQLPKPRYTKQEQLSFEQNLIKSSRNISNFGQIIQRQRQVKHLILPSINKTVDYDDHKQNAKKSVKKYQQKMEFSSGKSAVLIKNIKRGASNSLIEPRSIKQRQINRADNVNLYGMNSHNLQSSKKNVKLYEGRLRQLSPDVIQKLLKNEKQRYKIKSIIGNN